MSGSRNLPPLPAPGTRLDLEITDLSSRGLGVGRSQDGLVVMIRAAVPGDRVRASVGRRHGSWVEADLAEILRPSPDRVIPRCRHFGRCGGCALQNLAPAAQRRLKAGRVRALVHRCVGEVPVGEARAVGPDYGYRNRMEFACVMGPGGLRIGLHDRTGEVFDLDECHLPHPLFPRLVAAVRAAATQAGTGAELRRLDIRRSGRDGAVLLAVTVAAPPSAALLRAMTRLEPVNGGSLTVVATWPGGRRVVSGSGEIRERFGGCELPVAPGAFSQTHTAGAAALYGAALEWLAPAGGGGLLDLYSGAGALALQAAGRFSPILAVEAAARAVAAGRRAAARAGVAVRFLRDDALTAVARLAAAGEGLPAVAVNPPRTGLHRELPAGLARLQVRRLAYISCDPGTLARDLARLQARAFVIRSVTPFDLFPQTARVEAMACLEGPAAGS